MANKIKYGLCNVYYAVATYDNDTSAYTYGTPVAIPGGVNLSVSASGSSDPFYADNIVYYNTQTNAGYEGDLEVAIIPDSFYTDIMGETTDNNVMIENADATQSEFALMFQFEGDSAATRHVFWRCSASRPNVEGETREDKTTPKTETLTLTVMARENDHNVKGKCPNTTAAKTVYDGWFTTVWQPTVSAG